MSKVGDLFSKSKTSSQNKKNDNIPPGFIEMLKQSGEIYDAESSKEKKEKKEEKEVVRREKEKAQSHFQRVKRLEKEIYSRKKEETKKEVQLLRQALQKEIEQFKKQSQNLKEEVKAASQSPVINPGQSDITFFENILKLVRQLTQDVDQASLWMQAWSRKQNKRGAFWSNFTSKKGGAQYLLSSEHSASRSAG